MICQQCQQEIPNHQRKCPRCFPPVFCKQCGQEIPDDKLSCPGCIAAHGYQDILQFQRQFLPAIVKGDHPLTLTKQFKELRWHLALSQYAQAWCGIPLHRGWVRKRQKYPEITLPMCERCRAVFEGMTQEVR